VFRLMLGTPIPNDELVVLWQMISVGGAILAVKIAATRIVVIIR
jgi:hypothetical protein